MLNSSLSSSKWLYGSLSDLKKKGSPNPGVFDWPVRETLSGEKLQISPKWSHWVCSVLGPDGNGGGCVGFPTLIG